jgi:hypothetical protein
MPRVLAKIRVAGLFSRSRQNVDLKVAATQNQEKCRSREP